MNKQSEKLGLICGSGELPSLLINECKKQGKDFFIIGIENAADEKLIKNEPHKLINIAKIGGIIKTLKKENVTEIVLAGTINRPSFSTLRPDIEGAKLLTKILQKKSQGDDSVLTNVISYIEKNGFTVVGVHEILSDLLADSGYLTKNKPSKDNLKDIEFGINISCSLGLLDVGQSVIVSKRRVVAVEAAEGTDETIVRAGNYSKDAILVKTKKPNQETRVDLPTIGTKTVENAAKNGLSGIAIEAGATLVINKDAVIKAANKYGVFIYGFKPDASGFLKWRKEKFLS